jgi:tetratricopeptide (TPR) repeat protein
MRRFERAIGDFTETIRLKPDFSLALCNRAFANFELNRYDDALADYTLAIGQVSSLTYCYFGRGNLFLTIGEYQKAVDDFTEALSRHATHSSLAAERRPTKLSASVTTLSMIFAPCWMQIRTSKVRERGRPPHRGTKTVR